MLFYEVELEGPPSILSVNRTNLPHYRNEFQPAPGRLEIDVMHGGRYEVRPLKGKRNRVFHGTAEPGMVTCYLQDAACRTRLLGEDPLRSDIAVALANYRSTLHDTERTPDYQALLRRVETGRVILLPVRCPLGAHYALASHKMEQLLTHFTTWHAADRLRAVSDWYTLCATMTELVVAELKHANHVPSPSAMRYVTDAKEYIAIHYREKIRIGDIATQLSISEGHLRNLFKNLTALTLTDYINRYRIEKACSLLRTTPYSLQEMASKVGISDPAYLSRLFRKITGMTYSEFYQRGSHEAYNYTTVNHSPTLPWEIQQAMGDKGRNHELAQMVKKTPEGKTPNES